MKKSELKGSIREEIIDILEAATNKDVQAQKDYNKELERSVELAKQAGMVDETEKEVEYYPEDYQNIAISYIKRVPNIEIIKMMDMLIRRM